MSECDTAIYWPWTAFTEVHRKKDAGGLAEGFAAAGRTPLLLVSKSEAPPPAGVRLLDCSAGGASDLWVEFRTVVAALQAPSIRQVLVIRGSKRFLLVALFAGLRRRNPLRPRNRPRQRWTLKLDWDGRTSSVAESLKMALLLLVSAQLFDEVVIESSCGLERIRRWMLGSAKPAFVPDGFSAHQVADPDWTALAKNRIVLCVARVTPQKGIHVLLEAFAMLAREFPEWRLRIVGPIEDSQYLDRLVRAASSDAIADRVEITGSITDDQLRAEYRSAAIFCLPSFQESFGISRVEAAACGLPVVTSSAGCARDMEQMGMYVVPIGDAAATRDALRRLMADPELRRVAGERSRALVGSWESVARAFLALPV